MLMGLTLNACKHRWNTEPMKNLALVGFVTSKSSAKNIGQVKGEDCGLDIGPYYRNGGRFDDALDNFRKKNKLAGVTGFNYDTRNIGFPPVVKSCITFYGQGLR
jgi:hypothetical protein